MVYRVLADFVLFVHFLFIVFVLFGGLLALRWGRIPWVHIPAVIWGAVIEFFGWVCPLTPLENFLRVASGAAGYSGGFIEYYLLPVIYPAGLTREIQLIFGCIVVLLNVVIYYILLKKRYTDEIKR